MMSGDQSGSNALRIWQFSDTHLFSDEAGELYGINCLASLRRVFVLAMTKGGSAELAIFTGDLVHDGSVEAYQRLATEIETLGVTAYCLPGNHDDPTVMRSVLSTANVRCDSHIIAGAWSIVMLDTTVTGSDSGRLGERELNRLVSLLEHHPEKHTLLALHHPPLPTRMDWLDRDVTLDNPERLQEIVKAYSNIRGVIWGHAHQASIELRDGCTWAACPSTMAQFKPDVAEFSLDALQPGFRWLDLYPDGKIETDIIRL